MILITAIPITATQDTEIHKIKGDKAMKKKLSILLLAAVVALACAVPAMANTQASGENWIDAAGNTAEPRNSRDVRNNTNGFDTNSYTPISYEGEVTLYAQNYGYSDDDNYDIKLFISSGGNYTQIGRLYGYGDNLQVEVFTGHSVRLVWQRHQIENRYYVVDITGSFSTSYKKDFKGENTGYTSGNVYIKYGGASGAQTQSPASQTDVRVIVNGAILTFDQPPIIENGRTLVPLRGIFEALGANVTWNQSTQTVTAVKDGITVTLKIGSDILVRNGEQIKLDVPAKIVGGRTIVPARAVSESFGAAVSWDQTTRTVTINDNTQKN
jgi:hypothetical protein